VRACRSEHDPEERAPVFGRDHAPPIGPSRLAQRASGGLRGESFPNGEIGACHDLEAYLRDVLTSIVARHPVSRIDELLSFAYAKPATDRAAA
jgi:hypothetical protein